MKLDNFELNELEYEKALELDKRNVFAIYWSLLKREQIIIFTFFVRNDHNLVSIKITRLIFLICTDITSNVFFFSDETCIKCIKIYSTYSTNSIFNNRLTNY